MIFQWNKTVHQSTINNKLWCDYLQYSVDNAVISCRYWQVFLMEIRIIFVILVALVLLCTEIHHVFYGRFYILISSNSTQCPGQLTGEPCLTLQQFANSPGPSLNVSMLIMEAGIHILDSQQLLALSNIHRLSMVPLDPDSHAMSESLAVHRRMPCDLQDFNSHPYLMCWYEECPLRTVEMMALVLILGSKWETYSTVFSFTMCPSQTLTV